MILKALEMQGFKSFADKTVFEFEKGITAVVGPNGSGKSNISDAVRWVLGEQSTKSLRGSKMEDVIFSGTAERRAMGNAKVTLRLDNTDRSIKNYDTDEVTVTRKFYRSGDSEYLINGESVRLKDIHRIFMDTGLGRDGYSLVSQGKVDRMISSKGNERREMFEEAAGISHYRYSRNDSLKKLAQAEENMVRLRDILSELEKRVEPLRIQKEKAEKFLTLAQEKKELEIGLWLRNIEKLKDDLKKQEEKIELISQDYENCEEELTAAEEKIETAIASVQKLTEEIETIRNSVSENEEQALACEGKIAVLENSVSHHKETIERIEKEKSDTESSFSAFKKEIAEAEKEIDSLTKKKALSEEKLENLGKDINKSDSQASSLDSEGLELTAQTAQLTKELADNRVALQAAKTAAEEITSSLTSLGDSKKEKASLAEELQKQYDAKKEESDTLTDKVQSLSNSMEGYRMRFSQGESRTAEMKKQLDDAAFEIRKRESRLAALSDLEKNMEGYSGAVKAVIREKKLGGLGGIHGTVSSLINVKNEYSTAIEVAFGAAIQNIVTDNENDAKRAIEFLKRTNSGRATFLPLTAIKGKSLNETGLDDCYGFIDVAENLVDCDSRYRNIISSFLGRTVVAEDMNTAIAIGKKYSNRFKIVTLDGQVINAGGSMTGGSALKNAGLLSRSAEIDSIKNDIARRNNKLNILKESFTALTEDTALRKADLDGASADLQNAREEQIRVKGELDNIAALLNGAKSDLALLEKDEKTADERLKALGRLENDATEKIAKIENEIREKEEKITEIGSSKQAIALMREGINKQATDLSLEINGLEKDIEIRKNTVASLTERISQGEDRNRILDEETAKIKEEIGSIIAETEKLKAQAEGYRKDSSLSKEKIAKLQQERNEQEQISSKYRILERNKSSEREKLSGELARLEERKASMRKEYDETTSHLFEEYNLTRREALQLGIVIEDPAASKKKLNEIRSKIKALGSVNVSAIEEYEEVSERYEFLSGQIDDVEKSKKELEKLIKDLTDKMSEQFLDRFEKIGKEFSRSFVELFGGGSAVLSLEDPLNILESNIEIKVQPPGKNVQNIDLFSGGEKALSAIALLVSIIKVNPSPFCIFDEVEAALDEVNVAKYAQYIRRMTETTQFILITHRRGSMEEADMLYGVTMQEKGVSKVLELKTAQMAREMGIA